jgi:hypothetical protein
MHQEREQDRDRATPNRASNMEKAEGSREKTEQGVGSEVPPEAFGEGNHDGGGISNRPIEEEESRQDRLPPRGQRRDDSAPEDVER